MIDQAAADRVVAAAASAKSAGGRVLTGGTASGCHVAPTLVEGVPERHELAREEVFGPICLLQRASDLREAVALARQVEHGLVSAVYTGDLNHALAAADALDTGLVKVNAPTTGVDFHLPFGGTKASRARSSMASRTGVADTPNSPASAGAE